MGFEMLSEMTPGFGMGVCSEGENSRLE